jgi:hypothetical protein
MKSRLTNRLLAFGQLVTAPLLLLVFLVAEPSLIPAWPGYVGRCSLSIFDGRQR